jgi:hypothetical protein
LIALLALGCGGESKSERAEGSSGAEHTSGKPGPLPAPYEAAFTVQLRVPLSEIAREIDAQLPEHEAQDLGLVTREGKSPAIEASYEVWRDPVKLQFADGVLQVEVPVRYAARFNARVKSPFGGKWLTVARDEPWGTAGDPQRMSLRVHTQVDVSPSWELGLSSSVDAPEHGPPPEGNICTGGAFKLCIAKSSFASEVSRRIDGEIVPRIQKALDGADRRLQDQIALRSRVEQAWQALSQPHPIDDHDRWAIVEPRQAALDLRPDGDAIIVEAVIFARASYYESKPPAPAATPLPDKVRRGKLPGRRTPLPNELAPPQLQLWLKLLQG